MFINYFISVFNNTLVQEKYDMHSTTIKPMWISSTADRINVQEICKNNDCYTNNCVPDSYFDYDSLIVTPHWTHVLLSPEPPPIRVNTNDLYQNHEL